MCRRYKNITVKPHFFTAGTEFEKIADGLYFFSLQNRRSISHAEIFYISRYNLSNDLLRPE